MSYARLANVQSLHNDGSSNVQMPGRHQMESRETEVTEGTKDQAIGNRHGRLICKEHGMPGRCRDTSLTRQWELPKASSLGGEASGNSQQEKMARPHCKWALRIAHRGNGVVQGQSDVPDASWRQVPDKQAGPGALPIARNLATRQTLPKALTPVHVEACLSQAALAGCQEEAARWAMAQQRRPLLGA